MTCLAFGHCFLEPLIVMVVLVQINVVAIAVLDRWIEVDLGPWLAVALALVASFAEIAAVVWLSELRQRGGARPGR